MVDAPTPFTPHDAARADDRAFLAACDVHGLNPVSFGVFPAMMASVGDQEVARWLVARAMQPAEDEAAPVPDVLAERVDGMRSEAADLVQLFPIAMRIADRWRCRELVAAFDGLLSTATILRNVMNVEVRPGPCQIAQDAAGFLDECRAKLQAIINPSAPLALETLGEPCRLAFLHQPEIEVVAVALDNAATSFDASNPLQAAALRHRAEQFRAVLAPPPAPVEPVPAVLN